MISNKKKVSYIILAIVTLLIIDRCTVIDLSPTAIFKSKELKAYPYLNGVASTSTHEIKRLNDYGGNITYDTIHNYFLHKGEKFNALGKLINSVSLAYPKSDTLSIYESMRLLFAPKQSQYILGNATDSLVYDFSKNKIEQKLTKIIYSTEEYPVLSSQLYQQADVVLYRKKFTNNDDIYPIYIKRGNEWWLILHKGYYPDKKRYPEKYRKLIFLKDYKNQRYSYALSEPISEKTSIHYDIEDVVSSTIEKPYISITTELFTKDNTYERVNIMVAQLGSASFVGTEYSKLKKGDEFLYFKTGMVQHGLSKRQWSKLSCFSVPERFRKNTDVNFIVYEPMGNMDSHDDAGTYIVRPKETKDVL